MSWSPYPGGPVYATGPSGSAQSASMASSGSSSSVASSVDSAMSKISGITAANNAWSAEQASDLRDWQERQAEIIRKYNSEEAEKNRSWQEYMSSSAHQREIEDLKKAGLNPVLSVLGGNGASTTSGATASSTAPSGAKGDTDMSGSSALVSLLGSFLNQQTQMAQMNTSALTNLAVADKYTAMSKYTAELGAQTQLQTTAMNNAVSRYVSDNSLSAAQAQAAANIAAATIHAEATKYSADQNYLTQTKVAEMNGEINKELKQLGIDAQFDLSYNDYLEEFALKQAFGNSELTGLAGFISSNGYNMFGGDSASGMLGSGYRSSARDASRSNRGSGFNK